MRQNRGISLRYDISVSPCTPNKPQQHSDERRPDKKLLVKQVWHQRSVGVRAQLSWQQELFKVVERYNRLREPVLKGIRPARGVCARRHVKLPSSNRSAEDTRPPCKHSNDLYVSAVGPRCQYQLPRDDDSKETQGRDFCE